MIKLYYTDIGPLEDKKLFQHYYEQMSEYRRAKTDRFHHDKDRRLCLAAGILTDTGLRGYGLREADMNWEVTEQGKPFLRNEPGIFFSLSHSGTKAIACFSDVELGCDIEMVRDIDLEIAKRFFHENEYAEIWKAAAQDEKTEMFFRLWTLKESYIKATGQGLSMPLNSFEIIPGAKPVLSAPTGEKPYSFKELALFPEYRSAVCCAAETCDTLCEYVQL